MGGTTFATDVATTIAPSKTSESPLQPLKLHRPFEQRPEHFEGKGRLLSGGGGGVIRRKKVWCRLPFRDHSVVCTCNQ